jgi:hypothetical protein
LDSVHAAISAIRENPLRFPQLLRDNEISVRRALLKRFPYGIYFAWLDSKDIVQVIACIHAREEPGKWLRRVR